MYLTYGSNPIAGELFSVNTTDVEGAARLSWYLDDELVKTTECQDPPCYDEIYLSQDLGGSSLRVVVEDAADTTELDLLISGHGDAQAQATS
jgi:hypothetical protein